MARQYGKQRFPKENRYKIISRYRSYHGFTYAAMSATGQARRRIPYEPLNAVVTPVIRSMSAIEAR